MIEQVCQLRFSCHEPLKNCQSFLVAACGDLGPDRGNTVCDKPLHPKHRIKHLPREGWGLRYAGETIAEVTGISFSMIGQKCETILFTHVGKLIFELPL